MLCNIFRFTTRPSRAATNTILRIPNGRPKGQRWSFLIQQRSQCVRAANLDSRSASSAAFYRCDSNDLLQDTDDARPPPPPPILRCGVRRESNKQSKRGATTAGHFTSQPPTGTGRALRWRSSPNVDQPEGDRLRPCLLADAAATRARARINVDFNTPPHSDPLHSGRQKARQTMMMISRSQSPTLQ